MNKIYSYVIGAAALAASAVMTSCADDAAGFLGDKGGRTVEVTANIGVGDNDGRATRPENSDGLGFAWQAGDKVLVTTTAGEKLGILTTASADGAFTGTFYNFPDGIKAVNVYYLGTEANAQTDAIEWSTESPYERSIATQSGKFEDLPAKDIMAKTNVPVSITDKGLQLNFSIASVFNYAHISLKLDGANFAGQTLTITSDGLTNSHKTAFAANENIAGNVGNITATVQADNQVYVLLPAGQRTNTFSATVNNIPFVGEHTGNYTANRYTAAGVNQGKEIALHPANGQEYKLTYVLPDGNTVENEQSYTSSNTQPWKFYVANAGIKDPEGYHIFGFADEKDATEVKYALDGEINLTPTVATKTVYAVYAKWVDLGLSDGSIWLDRNVGAKTPNDPGLYVGWGELSDKKTVASGQYYNIFAPGHLSYDSSEKGNSNISGQYIYYKDIAGNASYDIAYVNTSYAGQLPTPRQFKTLFDETETSVVTVDGVVCMKLANKKDASKFILIPGCGVRKGTNIVWDGEFLLWTSKCVYITKCGQQYDPRQGQYVWYDNDLAAAFVSEPSMLNDAIDENSLLMYSEKCFGGNVRPVKRN